MSICRNFKLRHNFYNRYKCYIFWISQGNPSTLSTLCCGSRGGDNFDSLGRSGRFHHRNLDLSAFWLLRYLGQKNKIFFNRFVGFFIYLTIFVVTLWSFYRFNLIIRMDNIFGLDKLTFGMILGSAVFYLVDIGNIFIKRKNGKSLFPYQSMAFSLGSVTLASIGVYILINYYI